MILLSNRAVLYARFSSDNQRTESIDAQLRAMHAYCKQHQIAVISTYVDEAKSATTDRRPAFQQMISDSASHTFNILLVHKLDRFARNRYDSAIYKRELKKNGVTVYSVLENLDDSPESIIMESVLEGMSEYYSQNLAREVMKGLKETALQCKHTGGKPPIGYDVDPVSKKLIVNEVEAAAVRLIFEMYAGGCGYSLIINALRERGLRTKTGSEFRKNSLYSILTNQKYIGKFVFNRSSARNPDGTRNSHRHKTEAEIITVEGGCPSIVDQDIFEKVSLRLNCHKRDGGRNNAKHKYLLSGKVFCKECGRAMVGNARLAGRNRTLYITYRCPSQKHVCQNREINRDYLEKYTISLLERYIFNRSALSTIEDKINGQQDNGISSISAQKDNITQELRRVKGEMENIADAIGKGLISSVLTERLLALEAEKGQLELSLALLDEKAESSDAYIDYDYILSRYQTLKDTPASPEFRALVLDYIGLIQVGRYGVDFTLHTGLDLCPELDTTLTVRRENIYRQGAKGVLR